MSKFDNLLAANFVETLKRGIEIQAINCAIAVGIGWLKRNDSAAQILAESYLPFVSVKVMLLFFLIINSIVGLHISIYLSRNILTHFFYGLDSDSASESRLKTDFGRWLWLYKPVITLFTMLLPAMAISASFLHGTN